VRLRYTLPGLVEPSAILDYIAAHSQQSSRRVQARTKALTDLLLLHPYLGRRTIIKEALGGEKRRAEPNFAKAIRRRFLPLGGGSRRTRATPARARPPSTPVRAVIVAACRSLATHPADLRNRSVKLAP
jgi:hypothetical protein